VENKKVKKAVIPAAGLGTRFLPATKALAKEMLPIVDIPTIQYIVQEAVNSGIEEVLIITNDSKQIIHNHFDRNYDLEEKLKASNKLLEVDIIVNITNMAKVTYTRQDNPRGLGHAILCAKSFVGDDPFAILLGDDVVVNKNGLPALKQLIDAYDSMQASIIGVQTVAKENVNKYGIVTPKKEITDRLVEITDMIEKPKIEEAPSCLAGLGRYVLTPTIFSLLETQAAGANNEIQLTDAIKRLMPEEKVYAYDFEGQRYDVGDKFGYVKATIDFALDREDLKDNVVNYLKEVTNKL